MDSTLKGQIVSLEHISISDTENIVKWRNATHVKSMLYTQQDLTPEQHVWWLQEKVLRGHCSQFIIVENRSNSRIGTTYLKNIDHANNKAELGIFIGETKYIGKRLGVEAIKILLSYGFIVLKLNKIYLTVFERNASAIKTYQNAGFLKSSLFKEDFFRDGAFHNVVYMEMLSSDYLKADLSSEE